MFLKLRFQKCHIVFLKPVTAWLTQLPQTNKWHKYPITYEHIPVWKVWDTGQRKNSVGVEITCHTESIYSTLEFLFWDYAL